MKHRLDTIAHGHNPNDTTKMVSVFTSHPLFTVKNVKACNMDPIGEHDTCDKQDNDDATGCFMNGLGEDHWRQIQVKQRTTCSSQTSP